MSEAYRRNYLDIEWMPLKSTASKRRQSRNVAPYVISDIMPATLHMATGKLTDSKSHFRRMTKDTGNIEIGNDYLNGGIPERKPIPRPKAGRDIKEAIEQLKARL